MLSNKELKDYKDNGFIAPIDVQSIEEAGEIKKEIENILEVSGKKFTGNLPNIPPCSLTGEEAENLVKEFMRESNVILFLKNSFELTELENCEGKVIGTNFPQGGSVSTGDSLIFIIGSTNKDQLKLLKYS